MDDFLRSQPGQRQPQDARSKNAHDPAEVRLFYVALTRAKEAIDVPPTILSLIGYYVMRPWRRPPFGAGLS
jgi:hypothetical protein